MRDCYSYSGGVHVDATGRPAVVRADPRDGCARGRAEPARDDRRLLRHRTSAGTSAGQATSPRRIVASTPHPPRTVPAAAASRPGSRKGNNNNNNQICKAPECQKTSVALADRNSRAN